MKDEGKKRNPQETRERRSGREMLDDTIQSLIWKRREPWDVCKKLRKTQILWVSNWGRADFRVLRCLRKAEKDSDSVSVKLREGRLLSLEVSVKSWERLRFCECQTEGGQTSESWDVCEKLRKTQILWVSNWGRADFWVLRCLQKAEKDSDSVSVKLREGRLQSLEMSAKSWERLRFCECQTEGGQTSESWDVCEKLRKTQILSVSNWGRADFWVLRCLWKAEKDSDSVSVKLREGRLQSLEMSVKSWERLRFCQCQTEGGQTSESWDVWKAEKDSDSVSVKLREGRLQSLEMSEKLRKTQILSVSNWGRADFRVLRCLRKAEKDSDSVSVKLREGRLQSLEMSVKSWERLRFCECQTEGGQTSESWDVYKKLRKTQILSVSNWGRADFRVLRCLWKAEKDSDSVSVKLREGRLQSLEMSVKSWERLRFCECQTEGGQTSESWDVWKAEKDSDSVSVKLREGRLQSLEMSEKLRKTQILWVSNWGRADFRVLRCLRKAEKDSDSVSVKLREGRLLSLGAELEKAMKRQVCVLETYVDCLVLFVMYKFVVSKYVQARVQWRKI